MQIAEGLHARGHDITVLTTCSKYKSQHKKRYSVKRILPSSSVGSNFLPIIFLVRFFREILSYIRLTKFLKNQKFDLIYVWTPDTLFNSAFQVLEQQEIPTVYYFFDTWFSKQEKLCNHNFFNDLSRFSFIKKKLLKCYSIFHVDPLFECHFKQVQYCSSVIENTFHRRFSYAVNGKTILFGIDTSLYNFIPGRKLKKPINILFMGGTWKHKGIHIALSAVKKLHDWGYPILFHIYGGFDKKQKLLLQRLVEHRKMADYVIRYGLVDHSDLIKGISEHDILIFSSVWNEPYGLVPLEAMAAGAVVVSTGDGGSRDYSHDGGNCLLYSPFSSLDCANKIKMLIDSPDLYQQLRKQARAFVETKMQLSSTIDQIEQDLLQTIRTSGECNFNSPEQLHSAVKQ